MSKLNETRVFVTLIVSVDGAKGGHRQFNTVLHGLDDVERVVGQCAAGMVESEITRLAVQEDRYEEYVDTVLKARKAKSTNMAGGPSLGPAGQAVQAVEGVTGREAPTGAVQAALPDAERGNPATPPADAGPPFLEWMRRRMEIAEGLLRDDKPIERLVDVLVSFTLGGNVFRGTIRVPAGSDNVPLARPFLLEIRNLCNAQFNDLRVRPLLNRLHWSDQQGLRPGEKPCGNIVCEDQVVGGWVVK